MPLPELFSRRISSRWVSALCSSEYRTMGMEHGADAYIPKPFDRRLFERVSYAVAEAAVKSGVAGREVDLAAYREELRRRNIARG